ncbi:hypothetical protein XI09_16210 [Bradyrhizobium sp. CCBAU 11386]|uniref:hypothetical protein n=1 Tax=Bradyrhizobium sp. CCBAU 11386 TaxID=1630837 RepID=UPI0023042791|nr:hypothetical protein [Bradyrhizobium sp. CCBAU 11386]MDA9506148.1 hypothetical protein [Bradyrhizobium sp. CCBAU 11386]
MADKKFTGLSLTFGGLMEWHIPFISSGSASGGVVVTGFGGSEDNGMGLYGSIGTDKVDGDGGYSKGPYLSPWSSKFYGLFVGEESTLTYGNAKAVDGFSSIWGLHLGVVGLQIGIPFEGTGYSLGVTLGPGFFVNLGTVQGTATLTTQDLGSGSRGAGGPVPLLNEFEQYQELVGDAQLFFYADSFSSGSPTVPAIPYLQSPSATIPTETYNQLLFNQTDGSRSPDATTWQSGQNAFPTIQQLAPIKQFAPLPQSFHPSTPVPLPPPLHGV